MLYLKKNKQN